MNRLRILRAAPSPTLRRFPLRRAVVAALLAAAAFGPAGKSPLAAAPAPASSPAALIYAGWYGNTIPTPSFVSANKSFLETQPFDGLVVYLRNASMTVNLTTGVMKNAAISYDTAMSVLNPIATLEFTNLRENLGLIQGSTPPDFFDDWSTVVQNYRNVARAAKDAGLKGFCFDNEQYASPWGNYGSHLKYYASKTFAQYQAQAYVRGREIMAAMMAEFPDIVWLTLHGPYVSEPDAPSSLEFPQWQSGNELMGPFFAGHMEAAGSTACNMDGGELYTLRTLSQFQASSDWRKNTLPSDAVDCSFIPAALRTVWPGRSSISYGVYDMPFGGAAMDASILRSTTANALRCADRYVWFYAEASTYLLSPNQGGASAAWVDALRQARIDAGASFLSAPANLTLDSVSDTEVALSWSDTSSDETGFQLQKKTGASGTWSLLSTLNAGATSAGDSNLTPGVAYFYRVRAVKSGETSAWSNEVSTSAAGSTSATGAPAAPTNLVSAGVTVSSVSLAWTDNSTNENGFSIERQIAGTWTQVGWVAENLQGYSNTGLSPGVSYSFRVLAFNGAGNSPVSNVVTVTTGSVSSIPAAPSGLAVTGVTATTVSLGWTDNSSNENGFSIERQIAGTWTQVGWVADNVRVYTCAGLASGTPASFRVLAFNGYGNSPATGAVTATTLASGSGTPAAPSGLAATAVEGSTVQLTWTDNSSNETGFRIQRRRSGESWKTIATVGAGVTTYSDAGRTSQRTYVYRVRAYNSSGNSSYSNDARVTMP